MWTISSSVSYIINKNLGNGQCCSLTSIINNYISEWHKHTFRLTVCLFCINCLFMFTFFAGGWEGWVCCWVITFDLTRNEEMKVLSVNGLIRVYAHVSCEPFKWQHTIKYFLYLCIPKVVGSIPTMVRQTFQLAWCGCTLRVMPQISYSPWVCNTNTHKKGTNYRQKIYLHKLLLTLSFRTFQPWQPIYQYHLISSTAKNK